MAPPRRTNTPPRSGSAPIRLLRICLDERVLGAVECNESSTLADVRETIAEDEISGVPSNYRFLFAGAPVSRRQEGRRRAVDCFPFLMIVEDDAQIAPPVGVQEDDTGLAGATGGASPMANLHHRIGDEAGYAQTGAPGSMTLELQITDGPLEGTVVTVGEEGARIGRHTSNTLVIPEAGISRYHCEICYSDGEFCVRDLGSTTGTYFYLKPHGHFQMFAGLMVKLGETEFQVLSQSPPGTLEPEQLVLFYEGPLQGHKVHVPATGISIGRRHSNNLVLVQDGTVSAHHALIFSELGEFFLSDLGSCNGTCIRLSSERSDSDWHAIMDGDIIGAGCTKVRCRIQSH